MSYYDDLRHPQWQKKRLKIMERDGFICRKCGDGETTLNVHHSYYHKGCKPWEYPDDSMLTLCEPCHKQVEILKAEIGIALSRLPIPSMESLVAFLKTLVQTTEQPHQERKKWDSLQSVRSWEPTETERSIFERLSGDYRVGKFKKGILEVVVSNSLVLQELTFVKPKFCLYLAKATNQKVCNIKFIVGAVTQHPEEWNHE